MRVAFVEWQLRQVVSVFNQQIKQIEVQSQQQMRTIQIQSEAARAEAERKASIKASELMQQRLDAQQADLKKRADVAAEINEQAKKEEAWAGFYKPTRGCEKDNPNRETVKCGNDYIKAHNRFDATWTSNSN
jgi:predicted metal-dependent phosphoesterase TrpH